MKTAIERLTAAPPKAPHFGLEHISLTVDKLDAAASELKNKGAHFTIEPATFTPTTKIVSVRAPQGMLAELVQRELIKPAQQGLKTV